MVTNSQAEISVSVVLGPTKLTLAQLTLAAGSSVKIQMLLVRSQGWLVRLSIIHSTPQDNATEHKANTICNN